VIYYQFFKRRVTVWAILLSLCGGVFFVIHAYEFIGTSQERVYKISISSPLAQNERKWLNRTFARNLSDSTIAAALDSLGFFNPRFDATLNDTFNVYSGNRCRIAKVKFSGTVDSIADFTMPVTFPLFYNSRVIVSLVDTVLAYYNNRGYPFTQVGITLRNIEDADTTDAVDDYHLRLLIENGKKYRFGPTLYSGTFKTRPTQISHDLAFTPGQWYDASRVKKTITVLRSRPYITDVQSGEPVIFSSEKNASDTNADSSVPTVVVPLVIQDRSGLGLDGALGFETAAASEFKLNGTLDFSLLNLFGVGGRAALYYQGDNQGQEFSVTLGKDHFGKIPLFGDMAFSMEIRENAFAQLRANGQFLYEIRPLWQTGLRVEAQQTSYDTAQSVSELYTFSFVINRLTSPVLHNLQSSGFFLRAGTAILSRGNQQSNRWNIAFNANAHLPFLTRHALYFNLNTRNSFSRSDESLLPAEKFRIGGYQSVRGYRDREFAFTHTAYVQCEYLFYLSALFPVFVFLDGGVGFEDEIRSVLQSYTPFAGFGTGIRIPVRIGQISIEWGRYYNEKKGLGRIHIRLRNRFSRDNIR